MLKTFQPAHILLNMHYIKPFEVETLYVPEETVAVAIDKDGKIHAFASKGDAVFPNGDAWDTVGEWVEVADLQMEIPTWENMYFELEEFNSDNRCGGLFGIEL
uniref:Uncharacterized protein n=1 Tax=Acinetobacter phage vB_AbaSt_W16 TaxID=3116434 RepID=A0AB38ZCG6_9CAUD